MNDSNKKKCPNCNSQVDKKDKFCKICGHDFSKDEGFLKEQKTFEDFLLEASKLRNSSGTREKNNNKIKDINSSSDITDKLSINNIDNDNLKKEREKIIDLSDDELIYELEYEEKNKNRLLKKVIAVLVFFIIIGTAAIASNYIIPKFKQNLAEKNITSKSVKDKFILAIDSNSSESLVNLVTSSDKNIPFQNIDAKNFINEINSNPENKIMLKQWIEDDINKLKNDSNYKSIKPIRLINTNEGYEIEIDPIKLNIEQPRGADFYFENSKNYSFSGTKILNIKSNDIKIRQEFNISYFNDENRNIGWDDINLNKTIADFKIEKGDKKYEIRKVTERDCLVFVNDKNSGLTTEKFNEIESKNLIEDKDEVFIVAKGKSSLVKSSKQKIGWETWVRLHLND